MTQEQLEQKYARIPADLKNARRWVGFKIEEREGKKTKVPYNAINGRYGSSTEPNTWTSFIIAIMGCVKYHFDGIGFCLGENKEDGTFFSGVDLDNHGEADFEEVSSDFINTLNSYTEYSPSGKGIHIICKGKKPLGRCRKSYIEMYGTGRFFTVTGNVIKQLPVRECEKELTILWEKYLKEEPKPQQINRDENSEELVFGVRHNVARVSGSALTDDEVISMGSDKNPNFYKLYRGDISLYGNDHSRADAAFCQLLAFWTGGDKEQMDRIFRSSGLMRDKWDKYRGEKTYGEMTIDSAVSKQVDFYTPKAKEIETPKVVETPKKVNIISYPIEDVKFDEKGDPIINKPMSFKFYPLNDTGNAERFYDYFGDLFKYNEDDKRFMFWNGQKWSKDMASYVRKYANKLIEILHDEIRHTEDKIKKVIAQGENATEDVTELKALLKAQQDNAKRVANTTGKDAMIKELQALHDLPVRNKHFNRQEQYLNTKSGVVNLFTGEVYPFNRKYMLSKITNCGVSYDEPKVFLKFMRDILRRDGNDEETEELLKVVQIYLGETLMGRTNKDHLYIMYGSGGNGKSTFIKIVNDVIGEYGTTMSSEMLVSKGNSSVQSKEFSLDALAGARCVTTSETAEGQKLDEVFFKQLLSGELITAQKKYGDSYSFLPTFSVWMSTNNKPIIRATDDGTWRRVVLIPFLNKFKGKNKDVRMPEKLAAEKAQILGWMIQGAVKLHNEYDDKVPLPTCLEEALTDYKKELDVIVAFLNDMTIPFPEMEVKTQVLYREYKNWCKENGEYQYNERRFKLEMPKKGYPVKRTKNSGEVYVGLKLVTDEEGLIFGEED